MPCLRKSDWRRIPDCCFPWISAERMRGRKACIVTDSQVAPLYVSPVKAALEGVFGVCEIFSFPAGEGSKTLDTVQKLYTFLIEHHFDRKDVLIALGGGVTGDLTGFAAATYLRGIDFIQIPTTRFTTGSPK